MKYEMIFGDQSLFDKATRKNTVAIYKISENLTVEFDKYEELLAFLQQQPLCDRPDIAMRRIIRTPTWNIADQKAGKLPEVGCRVNFCYKLNTNWRTGEIRYIDDQCAVIKADDIDRHFVYEVDRVEFKPIESPEEKAARLRSEWCIKALSSCSILSEMQKYELKRLGGYIEDIYDALLSGDLPVPVKE